MSRDDHWFRDRAFAAFLFLVLQLCVIRFLQLKHSHWWEKLPLGKQSAIPPCMVGLIHHFVVIPIAGWAMYEYFAHGYLLTEGEVYGLSLWSFGYLFVDTFFYAIPESRQGNHEYTIHHILAVWVTVALADAKSPDMLLLVPDILMCELSTIFFAIGWIMRSTTYRTSVWIKPLEVLFAISFFCTRCLNLTWSVVRCWHVSEEIGWARFTLIPIVLMQWFWMYKIVVSVVSPKKDKSSLSDKKEAGIVQ